MDEVYRGYRIAIKQTDRWSCRVTHARGTHIPLGAAATLDEGQDICLRRARELIDRYIEFLNSNGMGEPSN